MNESRSLWVLLGATVGAAIGGTVAYAVAEATKSGKGPISIYTPIPVTPDLPAVPLGEDVSITVSLNEPVPEMRATPETLTIEAWRLLIPEKPDRKKDKIIRLASAEGIFKKDKEPPATVDIKPKEKDAPPFTIAVEKANGKGHLLIIAHDAAEGRLGACVIALKP